MDEDFADHCIRFIEKFPMDEDFDYQELCEAAGDSGFAEFFKKMYELCEY